MKDKIKIGIIGLGAHGMMRLLKLFDVTRLMLDERQNLIEEIIV